MKFIFVTGGVVSGLGKGITAASLGRLLKQRGYKVISQKLDPYINIDPGTMSPFEHGEVFITEDGLETDLDLGHYERFIDENLNKYSNITTGRIYNTVLRKERQGEYLGHTVQVVPHVTNEIKRYIYSVGSKADADITICEIGGTVGDIESGPFLEAARQIANERPNDVCFIHVVLVPFISGSDEYKSKPAQHSVKQLQSLGIRANIIVARCDGKLPKSIIEKLALFCSVKEECVFENKTLKELYEVPIYLEKQNFSSVVCKELGLEPKDIDLTQWKGMIDQINNSKKQITIGLVGKYVKLHDAYLSVVEALKHAGYVYGLKVNIKWLDSELINKDTISDLLSDVSGIILPGGFGNRGIEGMIEAAHFCRENNIPYFGICLGMQIAVIEFARNVLGYIDANSSEFDPESSHKVIDLMETQANINEKGGTMRLGSYPCTIDKDSLMYQCYKQELISERHRHRYEFNNEYLDLYKKKGIRFGGINKDANLVEEIEYPKNDFYLGVQYHPEFKSRPNSAHPLFKGFIESCMKGEEK